ncbi:MAG: hypothetical protein A2504_02655 [Bdellovibrionales bacterium RIFOXYD12_FULL_39_22]|nr:MAG: hypothetical protein A2385_12685 [Bdellovibrionales bacterium RIFOXYB1_FULL_39_21]OFZ41205.1 MAG: hypothetical protein A2485_01095 [Bdellovibrionales bacterium RIFOXYC12_FULL_39_17]OFZ44959.1 MAG: hypothetical protein A2404_11840 [Bdellovibrionales bacterium RIFOXYC1_FULL_39_130]OFZ74406.1 MAG: hypothetical protein A2560_12210 [Bdellovibrionales bacterium RIFOXYD1_FULL_39_84]OFZ74727.1 MAG: hypothetical protein A2451_09975 [Bdellovibrionales bacterium RIFOXYC2_FULL_39_8]OFZ92408.1 MAG:
MKKFFLSIALLTFFNAWANDLLESTDYSREAVRTIALSYIAGHLGRSAVDLAKEVDEIIVNDQRGIALYAVEVSLTSGSYYEVTFTQMLPIKIE